MPVLFLNLIKLLFLALLFVFLWQVARSIRSHLGSNPSAKAQGTGAELVLISGSADGRRIRLSAQGHVIGRSPDAEVTIDDPYASEFHARVGIHDQRIMVHDLGSTNGTYVNGRRVSAPTTVSRGDTVQIGKTILEVR